MKTRTGATIALQSRERRLGSPGTTIAGLATFAVCDGRRLALEDPNHRNEWQLKEIRAFTDAAVRMATREDREVTLRGQAVEPVRSCHCGSQSTTLELGIPCAGGV